MASARTRSIIEIVTITKHPRLVLILLALAVTGQLQAQIDLPAPDVPVDLLVLLRLPVEHRVPGRADHLLLHRHRAAGQLFHRVLLALSLIHI